jgi:hypothetical protein
MAVRQTFSALPYRLQNRQKARILAVFAALAVIDRPGRLA